jgi:hypothetical protein
MNGFFGWKALTGTFDGLLEGILRQYFVGAQCKEALKNNGQRKN